MAYDEGLAERIREVLAAEPGVTEMSMFGGLAFLLDGNMAVAASGQGGLMVRVDPAEVDELLSEQHAEPFEMNGREMRGWLLVDDDGLEAEADLERWAATGVAYARSLPSKG